jgi:hypothetical protein
MSENRKLGWTSTVFAILCTSAFFATIEKTGDFVQGSFEYLGIELPGLTKFAVHLYRYNIHLVLSILTTVLLIFLQIKARRMELVNLYISICLGILILFLCLHLHAYVMPYADIISDIVNAPGAR